MRKRADEILTSECIYDSVSGRPYKGYVAIKNGVIVDVGKGEVPDELTGAETRVSDYGSGTICAGLGDTHTFFTGYVIDALGRDLSEVKKLEELRRILIDELSISERKDVIFGNHLCPELAADIRTERMLDNESKEIPVIFFAPGHGSCAMNKAAKVRFGFNSRNCYSEAMHKIMPIYLSDREFIVPQFKKYMSLLNSRGVTSVKEMGFDDFYGFTDVLRELEKAGGMTVRVSFMSQPVGMPMDLDYGRRMKKQFDSEFVRFSGYNQMTDGLILKKQGHLLAP